MTNQLNVTLDTSVSPNVLVVDDNGGGNAVNPSPNPQTITWQLTGNLAQADFVAMADPAPGFEWIDQPPAGVFDAPSISANGRKLNIVDRNTSPATTGTWAYRLRASLEGTVYTTAASAATATSTLSKMATTDPTIINR